MKKIIKGLYTALVTPFSGDGVNTAKLKELIKYQINAGTDGIVLLGTTGESPTVSPCETDEIISAGLEAADEKIDVIIGCGSNDTYEALKKCRRASALGAKTLLVLTPYYNKTNTDGMIRHFSVIAEGAGAPIIIYNVPSRTGCSVGLDALGTLSRHENIIGIKEASGNISYAADVAGLISDDFFMMCGCDDITVPLMALGAGGVISVASNIIPEKIHKMTSAFLRGNTSEARNIQLEILPLVHALFREVNPIPVKAAMNMLGFSVGECRLPLGTLSPQARAALSSELSRAGLGGGF